MAKYVEFSLARGEPLCDDLRDAAVGISPWPRGNP